MNYFQIFSALLVFIVLILIVRYAWGIFFDKNYRPVEWEHACKEGRVSKELIRLERNYPDKVRFFNWWFQVERLKRDGVPGDFAELGVYKGESAKILYLMDPTRNFHLFDTFEGFKEEDLQNETGEAATYTTRNFADTSLEAVKRYLGESGRFVYHVGRFSKSSVFSLQSSVNDQENDCRLPTDDCRLPTDDCRLPTDDCRLPTDDCRLPTDDCRLSLVNLDADLYLPTKAGLEYFYPMLAPGGVIIVHDYTHKWPGIKKAVEEFASTVPESLVMVPDMDGSVMIIRNAV